MVYRVYSHKKEGFNPECNSLLKEFHSFLGINNLDKIEIYNCYETENCDKELFDRALTTVFSEPPVDEILFALPEDGSIYLGVEAVPGQFDMRADSAAQCLQLLSLQDKPLVHYTKVYGFKGSLSEDDMARIKAYLINPVESREASLELKDTLHVEAPTPGKVKTVEGLINLDDEGLKALIEQYGLAMDLDDLKCLQKYFKDEERRDPTITEIKVIDTYWSDHCRHTTFATHLDEIKIEDPLILESYNRYLSLREEVYGEKAKTRPITLMDLATIGTKALRKRGLTPELDESEEINACSINVKADVDGKEEDWLLMFKNETHNHPTEIEPFGGAATCIGGCIRDPLSGRAYVHQAMRISGSGDPRVSLDKTLDGKLPQRKIAQSAASGYSSYGNQIGLATGLVREIYNEGYIAKHLECGALVGAVRKENVRRERPEKGDIVLLIGGKTGRDGIGGATGSSKSHNLSSLVTMASEVQKGNAPEERKIQRLFRNSEVTKMIKRCNDFGAGGVSVAIGELADGLQIDLNQIHKKYEGLDGTELAISESQERMAVVVERENALRFIEACNKENLEAYPVAVVTDKNRMVMTWKDGVIANLSRDFLNSNGATKHASVKVNRANRKSFLDNEFNSLESMATSLKCASQRGLTQRFDSTVGAKSLLMPYGGKTQHSPSQSMAALLPVLPNENTKTGSIFSYGFDPDLALKDPYAGAYAAIYMSVAKTVASGADYHAVYLSLQEFFEKLRNEPERWGKPFSALLGALDAQMEIGTAAIGGKDSMSGSFMDKDVPPTLISFAVAPCNADDIITTDFKEGEYPVCLFGGISSSEQLKAWDKFISLRKEGKVKAAYAVESSIAEAIMNMSFGNEVGFTLDSQDVDMYRSFPGAIIAQLTEKDGYLIGHTNTSKTIKINDETTSIEDIFKLNEAVLNDIYPIDINKDENRPPLFTYEKGPRVLKSNIYNAKPKALIPVFPGTNCEYDTADALLRAGADAEIVVLNNLSPQSLKDSAIDFASKINNAQMIIIPGGFSGGDEPEGSAKFITAFFRNPIIKDAVGDLMDNRSGMMLGICNGFQALIKLGLLPYGRIVDINENCPTLSFNTIGRHQSMIVNTRVCSNLSPWMSEMKVGDIVSVPISHGEGRFLASDSLIEKLAYNGQIATQYVDNLNLPSMKTEFNPNGSIYAIEGITSVDGRILGKMGHSERIGKDLYKNVVGEYEMGLFRSAVKFFNK